ncbi:MAG: TldD/PmbA family protein [Gammaproteobacteria bacterium]|nr:TldD/PmbA family protein [Gammaproteobacteria bacterium]MDE0251875.1 TldD/PmbA family protein [Gammaproteobacteria bacterium]MDE0403116.1 TldD/PmbA family protein [Gammaproteobacteria bacterium]
MSPENTYLIYFLALCMSTLLAGTSLYGEEDDEVLTVMFDELERSYTILQTEEQPPYFVSYEISQEDSLTVNGSFGQVFVENRNRVNRLYSEVRVGGFELDNTHPVPMSGFGFGGLLAELDSSGIPLDNADALRTVLWLETDKAYKQAINDYANVLSAMQSQVEEDDQSGDFSSAPAETYIAPVINFEDNGDFLRSKVEQYTSSFSGAEHILSNDVSISQTIETRWYVNTDGSRIKDVTSLYYISISASAKAEDGMILQRTLIYQGDSLEVAFIDEKILADTNQLIVDLEALRDAPLAEPFEGPAILSGRASGVFFHEILGHRLEGHRQKHVDEGQTFKDKLGEAILPDNFSIIFDPTVTHYGNAQLAGDYRFDSEGVKAQRVVVVDRGVLKQFLMSRTPIEGFPSSNGHGRKSVDANVIVPRQSNMFVEVENAVSPEELEQLLIDRVTEQGKEYGLYVDDIQGGFTNTGRFGPNAYSVLPVLVYKIYTDGTRELIRGVNLIGTPLTTFSRVEQASTEIAIFDGMCGAESGWIPVSTVAPSILVSQIEVQRADQSRNIPPILPSPVRPPADRTIRQH